MISKVCGGVIGQEEIEYFFHCDFSSGHRTGLTF